MTSPSSAIMCAATARAASSALSAGSAVGAGLRCRDVRRVASTSTAPRVPRFAGAAAWLHFVAKSSSCFTIASRRIMSEDESVRLVLSLRFSEGCPSSLEGDSVGFTGG